MYNPCIRGWITYYSHFYKTQLRPTLKRIDAYVIRWARRKYKRMVHQTKGAKGLVRPAAPGEPNALRSLAAMPWQRPNIGSRVTREGHARFWERPGVKFPRANSTTTVLATTSGTRSDPPIPDESAALRKSAVSYRERLHQGACAESKVTRELSVKRFKNDKGFGFVGASA